MTIYDGTDTFTGNNVTGAKLDSVSLWHGTTSPTAGSNKVPTNGLFFNTSSGLLYENTGTLANPTWTQRSSSGTEFYAFTSATTFTPSKQTGKSLVVVDSTNQTKGYMTVIVDSTEIAQVNSGLKNYFILNPSTSLSIKSNNTTLDETGSTSIAQYQMPQTYHNGEFGNFTSEDGTYYYLCYSGSGKIACFTLTTPYAFEGGKTLLGEVIPANASNQYFSFFNWNNNGTKIYGALDGAYTNTTGTSIIYEYTPNGAYNLYGMNTSASASKSLTSIPNNSGRHILSSDGTKLYTYCSGNSTFYRHNLSTPWNITTASYHSSKTGLSTYPTGGNNMNTFIDKDGKYLLVTSYHSSNLYGYRYTMSTPYDLSTLTYTSTTSMGSEWRSDREIKIVTGNQTHVMGASRNPYRYTWSKTFTGTAYTSVT